MSSLHSIATNPEYYTFDLRRLFGHPVRIVTTIGSVRTGILTRLNYRRVKMKLMPRDDTGLFEDFESTLNVPVELVLDNDNSDRMGLNEVSSIEAYDKGDVDAIRP